MQTAIGDIAHVSAAQLSKTVTINEAFERFSKMLGEKYTKDLSLESSPFTIPYSSAEGGDKTALEFIFAEFTNLPGNHTVHVPASKHLFFCKNADAGSDTLTVKTAAGTGITISAGQTVLLYADGVNVIQPGVGVNTLDDIGDVVLTSVAQYQMLRRNGSSQWVNEDVPYDVAGAINGVPTASQVLLRYTAVRAFRVPSGGTGSQAKAGTAATGSTTFDLLKNGVSFGSVAWSAAGTTGSFTIASNTDFAAGDILTIVAPGTPDATLANVGITLAGIRR